MIYCIVFDNDARKYVGSTQKPYIEERYAKHILDCYSKKINNKLYNFMRQFPPSNFKLEVLQKFDVNSSLYSRTLLRQEEDKYIRMFNCIENGFNKNRASISEAERRDKKKIISANFKLKNPLYFKNYYYSNKLKNKKIIKS